MAEAALMADTSVIVPSLIQWHEQHVTAARALQNVGRISAQAFVESYSVLTRLPRPGPVRPDQALQLLRAAFPAAPACLSPSLYERTIQQLAEAGIGGGRVHDAIVGATAVEAGAVLLTADRRALQVYAVVGARAQLVL